ncbi:fimbrial biogenesis chaperone [Spirosoma koreense]
MTKLLLSPIGRAGVLALILCLTDMLFCQAQIGFQVSPAKLYFTQRGTAEQTLRLHLKNPMDTRLILQATCADWRRDSTGDKVYYPSGTLPTSSCSLFKITPSLIELAPGEERDVLVTLTTGSSNKLNFIRNGMLLLTQSNEQEVARLKGASQFIVKAQIGVHVYVLPEETPQADIAITGLDVAKAGEQYQVKVQVNNTGGTLLESELRLEYLNLETMEEVKTAAVPVNTMPKDAYKVTAAVPANLSAGKYLIVAVLDSGPSQALKVAELEANLK